MSFDENNSKLCLDIHSWIDSNLNNRASDTNVNRASSAPGCVKKRWFKANGFEGEPMQSRSFITFGFGDLTEHWMKALIKLSCVGPDRFYAEVDFGKVKSEFTVQHRSFEDYEQETLTIQIPGGPTVTGHADGWGKRNSDGQWELIEIKSSSTIGFEDFKRGETPDYIRQVHTLMLSEKAKFLGVKSARFLYMNKNTSHIHDRSYDFDPEIARQVIREFIVAAGEAEPMRPYEAEPELYRGKPTGNYKLGYPCGYCEFKEKCFSGLTREINKYGTPVWYVTKKETA